jgi:hypothetical protein
MLPICVGFEAMVGGMLFSSVVVPVVSRSMWPHYSRTRRLQRWFHDKIKPVIYSPGHSRCFWWHYQSLQGFCRRRKCHSPIGEQPLCPSSFGGNMPSPFGATKIIRERLRRRIDRHAENNRSTCNTTGINTCDSLMRRSYVLVVVVVVLTILYHIIIFIIFIY